MRRHAVAAACAAFFSALVACSGGGGKQSPNQNPTATSLQGTAAAGAPLIGIVTVKDSSTPAVTRVVAIDSNGRFTLDTTGLKAPFMLRADGSVGGKSYSLYSAGVAADLNGTLNITPLTDLIIANVAHDLASNVFASGGFGSLTSTEIAAKQADLRDKLTPILTALGVATSTDLLRMSFSADHSGLDAVLDVLDVQVDTGTKVATIQNLVNGTAVTSAIDTGTLSGTIDPGNAATAVTAVQAISSKLEELTALYATGLPTQAQVEAIGLFDTTANFLSGGRTWDMYAGVLTGKLPVGCTFANFAIESDLGQPTMTGKFDFVVNGHVGGTQQMVFAADGNGVYHAIGDQRIVQVDLFTHSEWDAPDLFRGYLLDVQDPGNFFGGNGKAVLSGPGGVHATFVQTIQYDRFTQTPGQDDVTVWLTDPQISQVPEFNTEYTLDVMDAGTTTPTASYRLPILRRPPLSTETATSSFITAGSYTPSNLGTFAGGTISASFGVPVGVKTGWFFVVFQDDAGHSLEVDGDVASSGTSGSITVSPNAFDGWLPTRHGYSYVGGTDAYGREFETRIANF